MLKSPTFPKKQTKGFKMKKSAYTIGSLIILLISAFIFVLVPMLSGGRRGKRIPPFGKYAGTEIRYEQGSDFAEYVSRYAENYKSRGIQLSPSDYRYLFSMAFNTSVSQLAFEKAATASGYIVPKSAVNRAMMPNFADETGKYSEKIYKLADPQKVLELRNLIEQSLVSQRVQEDLFGSSDTIGDYRLYGLKTSDEEISYLQKLGEEMRKFNMVSFDMNKYPDSEKAAYGAENSEKFKKYDLSVITVSDKSTAETVAKRIAGNEIVFSDAVGEYSQKSYTNDSGKMNLKFSYQIEGTLKNSADFEKIRNLKPEELSGVIQTTVGFSIFRCDSEATDADFSEADTLKIVYNYINMNEASKIEDYFKAQAESFIAMAKESNFDSACKKFDVPKTEIPELPLNYGNVNVAPKIDTSIEGLSMADTNENFLKEAFSLSAGEISKPITNGRNIIVLQFLATAANTEEPATREALEDEIATYDSNAAQEALLSSPKLQNNFDEVYAAYFSDNR